MVDPKFFLKAPWVPLNTNFEGGPRAEKTQIFWSIFFSKKCIKTPFRTVFFPNFACGAENLCSALVELRKLTKKFVWLQKQNLYVSTKAKG